MDSYRVEKQALRGLQLPDDEAVIDPIPVAGGGRKLESELDRLSNIIKSFNEQFGTLFDDADRVARRFGEDIAPKVAADPAYQNAKLNTPQTARIEHDKALGKVMLELLKDDTEVYKQFVQNPSFKRFVTDMVFGLTSGSLTMTTGRRPLSRLPTSSGATIKHRELEEHLAQSSDARDRLGAVLLGQLEHTRRITLGDALSAAEKLGLGDDDGFAAVERLARPRTAGLHRFYVDRSGSQARIVDTDEVRERAGAPEARREWASSVEVVWAASETDAIAGGAS
jgi:type I restriction enzyme R subunit